MTIKGLFEDAIEYDQVELQALIIHATIESKELSMDDDASKLNRYLMPDKKEVTQNEIKKIIEKYKMNKEKGVYEVHKDRGFIYVYATSEKEALYMAKGNRAYLLPENYLLSVNGHEMNAREASLNKQAPTILGAFEHNYKF